MTDPESVMSYRFDTYCGLYCGACDVMMANRKGSTVDLAKAWNRQPEELRCNGCKSPFNAVFCVDCGIRTCAQNKAIEFCSDCGDYPCQRLMEFRNDESPHHSVVLKSLDYMRDMGVAAWLVEQANRWSCPACGSGFLWYDRTCRACGEELKNCEQEDLESD